MTTQADLTLKSERDPGLPTPSKSRHHKTGISRTPNRADAGQYHLLTPPCGTSALHRPDKMALNATTTMGTHPVSSHSHYDNHLTAAKNRDDFAWKGDVSALSFEKLKTTFCGRGAETNRGVTDDRQGFRTTRVRLHPQHRYSVRRTCIQDKSARNRVQLL